MHAAGVKFDHSFLVRQSAQANTCLVWLSSRVSPNSPRGIQLVPAALQEGKRIVDVVETVMRRDDNWPLVGIVRRGTARCSVAMTGIRGRMRPHSCGHCPKN